MSVVRMEHMAFGLHKPLAASLILHALALGAAAWTLARMIPHPRPEPPDPSPAIVLAESSDPANPSPPSFIPRFSPPESPTSPRLAAPSGVMWPAHPAPTEKLL